MPRDLFADTNQSGPKDLFEENNIRMSPKMNRPEAAGRAGLQGLSFGFGDELIGAAKNLGNKAARGIERMTYGDNIIPETSYRKERDIARERLDQAREQYPIQSGVSEIGASLLAGRGILKAGGGAFTGAKTFMGKVGQGSLAAAVDSAIYGAGEAGEVSDIPESMLKSGAAGAVFGATLHPLIAGAGATYQAGKRFIKGKDADNILGSIIDPQDAKQMANRLERAAGRETLPIDLQNKEVSGLTKLLGKQKGSEKIIEQIVSRRASTSPLRVSNLLNKISSNERYFGTLDELDAGRKAAAQPLIEQAYKDGAEIPTLFEPGTINYSRARSIKGNPITDNIIEEVQNINRRELPLETYKTRGGSYVDQGREPSFDLINGYSPGRASQNKSYRGGESVIGMDYATGQVPKRYEIESSISERKIPFSPVREEMDYMTGKRIVPITEGAKTRISHSSGKGRIAVDRTGILGGKQPLNPKERALASEYEDLAADPRFQDYAREFGNVKPNSVEMLHNIRKSVDAERSILERNLAGPSPSSAAKADLRSLNNFRTKIKNVMYKATGSGEGKIGTMEEADKIYSDSFSLERAQELGRDFSKIKSDVELRQVTKDLNPDQLDAFRIGVRQDLYEKALSTSDRSANAAERIFGNPLYRKKLAVAFPDKKQYLDFAKRMIDEIRIVRTKQELLGGIRINPDQLDEGKVIDNAINFVTSPSKTANVIKAVKDSIQKKYLGINSNNAKALAEILTSREKSIEALKRVANNADAKQRQMINSIINDNIRAVISAQMASGLIDKELTKSDPSKRSSYSLISDANANEPTNEELMRMAEEQRKRYPGIYANVRPEEQARMLTRGRGEDSRLVSDEPDAARLLDLQEQERKKYPGIYANVPRLKKQNYGGN